MGGLELVTTVAVLFFETTVAGGSLGVESMAAATAEAVVGLDSLAAVRAEGRARLTFLNRGADGGVEVVVSVVRHWRLSRHGWGLAHRAGCPGGSFQPRLELFQAVQALVDFLAERCPGLESLAMVAVHELDHPILNASEQLLCLFLPASPTVGDRRSSLLRLSGQIPNLGTLIGDPGKNLSFQLPQPTLRHPAVGEGRCGSRGRRVQAWGGDGGEAAPDVFDALAHSLQR